MFSRKSERNRPYSPPRWKLILILLLAIGNTAALAADDLRLSGFGTIRYGSANRSDIVPALDVGESSNTQATRRWSSSLGLQLEYAINPAVDLVGQIVFKDHTNTDLNSSTELAYVAIRPTSQVDLRLGRLNYDAFLMSDYRKVGYAYSWARAPVELYGWIPIAAVDGVDAAYNIYTDDARWRIKVQAANSKTSPISLGASYDFKAEKMLGLSVSRQSELWRAKAAYSQFTVANEIAVSASLLQALDGIASPNIFVSSAVSAEAADLRNNITFKGAKVTYATIGATYDDGIWLAQSELVHSSTTVATVPNGHNGYLSVGRRFGDWTHYVVASAYRPDTSMRTAANVWPPLIAPLLHTAISAVNLTRIEQDTLSLGTRWDFNHQAALKLQWIRTFIKPNGYGLWYGQQLHPGTLEAQATRINQVSATLDFAF